MRLFAFTLLFVHSCLNIILAADSKCPSTYLCASSVYKEFDAGSNCQCDSTCRVYGDCCVNSPYFMRNETRLKTRIWKCVNLMEYGGIYMRAACPLSWSGNEVRIKCEEGGVLREGSSVATDPIAMTPVTSLRTGVTYQNFFCAFCSHDSELSIYWIPRIECEDFLYYNSSLKNVNDEFVWSRLKFNQDILKWGVYLENVNASLEAPPPHLTHIKTLTGQDFVVCNVMVQMPEKIERYVRRCKDWVNECPAEWTDNSVRELCHSYTAAAYPIGDLSLRYRNVHCAICNGQSLSHLSCLSDFQSRNINPSSFAPNFAFLFDLNEKSGEIVGKKIRCTGHGEIYDPFFKICRQMVCLNSHYQVHGDHCVPLQETTINVTNNTLNVTGSSIFNFSSTTTITTKKVVSATFDGKESEYDDEEYEEHWDFGRSVFLPNRTKVPKRPACVRFNISRLHYHIYPNGSVYIDKYERLYEPKDYVSGADGSILICAPPATLSKENKYISKFSSIMTYVTLVCLSISILCLVLHLVIFALFPELRNIAGKNVASLSAALLLAYIVFIVSQFQYLIPVTFCRVLGFILYYSFMATFFWMSTIAFDTLRSFLVATRQLRVLRGKQSKKFLLYSVYSWLGPLALVATAAGLEYSDVSPLYKPGFGSNSCWFGSRRALLLLFVIPIGIIMLVNAIQFGYCSYIIVTNSKPIRKGLLFHPHCKLRRNFKLHVRLAVQMGFSWMFGILAGFVDEEPLWYIFLILNSLHGLFIFLSFTCTHKVKAQLTKKFGCGQRRTRFRTPKKLEAVESSGSRASSETSTRRLETDSM